MAEQNSLAGTRTVTWSDPREIAAGLVGRTGLEHLEAIRDGVLPPPPIAALINMDLTEVSEGRVVFTCELDASTYNPIGTVHGGLLCTLLDSACGCAMQSVLPAGTGYTSVEIKVSYLRAVSADSGPLTCVGTVVKPGRRIGFTEATVTDVNGKVVATATSTLAVLPLT